jgi:hypothetical protein
MPARRIADPAAMSSPRRRRLAPRRMPCGRTTAPSTSRASSCMKTVSRPGGIGAPVKMRTAVPGRAVPSSAWPAAMRAATGSRVASSGARSAKATA